MGKQKHKSESPRMSLEERILSILWDRDQEINGMVEVEKPRDMEKPYTYEEEWEMDEEYRNAEKARETFRSLARDLVVEVEKWIDEGSVRPYGSDR